MTYSTTMTSKGQITVPAPIRKKLGLQPGSSINIKLKGNTAVVELNDWQKGLAEVRAEIAGHMKKHGITPPKTDEDFHRLREEAHEAAARDLIERHKKSLEG